MACIAELVAAGLAIDARRVLVAGHSGGGSSAPYLATNEELFTAFAVLHGGAFPGGFGKRQLRGWFSTGSQDGLRPPNLVRTAFEEARGPGSRFEMHVFEEGHGIGDEEPRAVVAWWLGG